MSHSPSNTNASGIGGPVDESWTAEAVAYRDAFETLSTKEGVRAALAALCPGVMMSFADTLIELVDHALNDAPQEAVLSCIQFLQERARDVGNAAAKLRAVTGPEF